MATDTEIEKYLKMSGQTKQELFGGAQAFGMEFIYNELVPKALKENKKIVWRDEGGIDEISYSFEEL